MSGLIRKSVSASTGGRMGKKFRPKKPKSIAMPEADDEAIRMARKRSVARQKRRTGRISTILSGGSNTSTGSGYGG